MGKLIVIGLNKLNLSGFKVIHVQNNRQSWCPPEEGWVKVSFDANVAHDFTRGLGVDIRNNEGIVLTMGVTWVDASWD